mgnify:CR=1 FL=1
MQQLKQMLQECSHLVRAGRIASEDLTRAQALQAGGDQRRIGAILVAIGAITTKELAVQVRAQIEEVVFTMLGWSEGYFVFEEAAAETIPREADVRISVEALLLEGARRIDEWSRIRARVPHLGVIPRITALPEGEPGSLVLNPFEWRGVAGGPGARGPPGMGPPPAGPGGGRGPAALRDA